MKACLKERIKHGETIIGTWAQIYSAETIEILCNSGFDFLIVDTEHGYFGIEQAENLVRAADGFGVPVIIRVAELNSSLIMKALDIGAQGVLIPQICTKEEALLAVSSTKYPPEGIRGACPSIRAGKHFISNWKDYSTQSNSETVVFLLVEGAQGIENFEQILTVEGIDAILPGPFDLSVSLGVEGNMEHPLVIERIKTMIHQANKEKTAFVSVAFDPNIEAMIKKVRRWRDLGSNVIAVQTDKIMLSDIAKRTYQALRNV